MKRYLCPICDRELTARSYCPTCRKIVKNPVVYDGVLPNEDTGNYLLNHQELHPDRACVEANRERVCETPQEKQLDARFTQTGSHRQNRTGRTTQQRTSSSGTVYQQYRGGQSTAPGSQIWRSGSSAGSTSGGRTYSGSGTSSKKGRKGCRSGCLTVIIILWLIGFIGGLLGDLIDSIDVDSWFEEDYEYVDTESVDLDDISEEYVSSEEDDADADWDDDWETADYEEILAIGERCNGYWHYPMDGKEMYELLESYVTTEMGLIMTEQSDYMTNDIGHYDDGDYTYYDRCYYWDWDEGYFGVGDDSVTGELHYVYVNGWNADQAIDICMKAFSVAEDPESAQTMKKSLLEVVDKDDIEDGYFFDMGNSTVWICKMSEGYYTVEISPVIE